MNCKLSVHNIYVYFKMFNQFSRTALECDHRPRGRIFTSLYFVVSINEIHRHTRIVSHQEQLPCPKQPLILRGDQTLNIPQDPQPTHIMTKALCVTLFSRNTFIGLNQPKVDEMPANAQPEQIEVRFAHFLHPTILMSLF